MPILNPDNCFAQQPQRVNVTVPEALLQDESDQWLISFGEQLAIRLNLSNQRVVDQECSQKEAFFYHLNRHAGVTSSYSFKNSLRESLKHLYCFYRDPKTRTHHQYMIAKGIYDDVSQCSPGFHNRVLFIQALLNEPTTLDELLAQVRFHLVDKIARVFSMNNAQNVHVHNRFFAIAHQSGYGVWALNKADLYRSTGSSNVSNGRLQQVLTQGFDTHFRLFGILNALCKQLEALFATWGYEGNYTKESAKEYKEYAAFSKLANKFTTILDNDLFDFITDEETLVPKVLGINWQKLKYALLKTLCDNSYLIFSPAESDALSHLPNITNHTALNSLIISPHELAECLMVGGDWPMDAKANLVLKYIEGKTVDAQETVLNVLDDETPQLTKALKRHLVLQPFYFPIAVQKKEIDTVRTHIEQGADINAALGLLFNEEHKSETLYWLYEHKHLIKNINPEGMNAIIPDGKYKNKTILAALWNTKKGRQVLLENNSLRDLFSEIEIKRAQDETPNMVMAGGFFKRPDVLATKLCRYVVYGDLKNANKILTDHPQLVKKLLTEKITVTDYSGCKKKHKTAFQLALCAWDVKLNVSDPDAMAEMLKKYMDKEDVDCQYNEIFPEGCDACFANQKPFDYSEIIQAITQSSREEVQKALDLEQPNHTALWNALEKFRAKFTELSKKEMVWNPQHLVEAFKQHEDHYSNWDTNNGIQQALFWRQVIGYTERFLPANIAMDFAQGLYHRVGEKKKPFREFKFQYSKESIYPLSHAALSGLGYKYAGVAGGAHDGRGILMPSFYYKTYVEQKQQHWENLCSPDPTRVLREVYASDILTS